MEKFENELKLFRSPFARDVAKKMIDSINDEFFEAAASSTGKYHPEYAIGRGGLYRHTCAAVGIAEDLMNLDFIRNKLEADYGGDWHDVMLLGIIMHDSCKSGKDWGSQYTRHDHPILAGKFVLELRDTVLKDFEAQEWLQNFCNSVKEVIVSHMGQWNTCRWDRTVLPTPETSGQKFVHLCDYLASRKYLAYEFKNKDDYYPNYTWLVNNDDI